MAFHSHCGKDSGFETFSPSSNSLSSLGPPLLRSREIAGVMCFIRRTRETESAVLSVDSLSIDFGPIGDRILTFVAGLHDSLIYTDLTSV